MAKSQNPMEAYRREQKKKELKKHRMERQKDKQAKLSAMDPAELKEQLKNLERQVSANPTDGPTRKRKQELEDTLRAVVKKQKEVADEERRRQKDAPPPPLMSMAELNEVNKEKFQNPENSIYYHPTLNPFGAPPPGKPQVYRNMPTGSGAPRGPPRPGNQQKFRGPPPPKGPPPSMEKLEMVRRPGKLPPLPPGPPPPGTIQVPSRPPLPSGALPARPPPPPPIHARAGTVPPSPYPIMASSTEHEPDRAGMDVEDSVVALYPTTEHEDSVIAPYPPPNNQADEEMDEEAAERAAESRAQLRSLVPVALRVQRQVPAPSSSGAKVSAPPILAPRRAVPAPAPAPRPSVTLMSLSSTTNADNSSVSKEFDAFMDEVKELF